MDELVDQILATDALSCTSCRKFLKCPVMLLGERGNVCAECYETIKEQPDVKGLRNLTLDTLLNSLEFPCKYEHNGCDKRLTCNKLHDHVVGCQYKTVECLLKPPCNWTGTATDLRLHFSTDHVSKVHTSEDDNFRLPYLAVTDANILKTTMGTFMLYINIDKEKVMFYMYDMDQIMDMKECTVKVTCLGDNQNVAFECKIVKDIMLLIEGDASVAQEQELAKLVGTEHIAVVFQGEGGNNKMGAAMLEILECLVCKNYMRPPIYQCVKGHDICSVCKLKIQTCPLCQSQYTGTRNYSLEGLVGQMRYPCLYEEQGCSVRALASAQHELVCNYQPWHCPVESCTFKSVYSELLGHMELLHAAQCILGTKYVADEAWKRSLRNSGQGNGATHSQTVYFLTNHKLFKLTFTGTSAKCTWNMTMIAPKDDTQYRATVNVEDADSVLGVAVSGLCQYKANGPDPTNGNYLLTIPTNILADFIRQHAEFKYFITLEKTRSV